MWDHLFLVAMSTSASVFPRVFKIAEANNDVSHALLGYAYHRIPREHCYRENCLCMTYGLYDKEGCPVVISSKEYHRMIPVIEQIAWSISVVPMVMSRTLPADRMGSIADGSVKEQTDEPPAQIARIDEPDHESNDSGGVSEMLVTCDTRSDDGKEGQPLVSVIEDDLDSLLFGEFVYK